MRKPLQKQLLAAWKSTIAEDYCSQRINSERSLQAALWYQIGNQLPDKRRTFIEPTVDIELPDERIQRYRPDIVVCSATQVIAIIEIKYCPRTLPQFAKDIATLRNLSKHRNQLALENERFRGMPGDERTYSCSTNALFVWAGIHGVGRDETFNRESMSPIDQDRTHLKGCFFRMHAETATGAEPNIFARFD